MTFLDVILDKTLRSTVALLAARGRGKSAALGLSVAGAIAVGYCACIGHYVVVCVLMWNLSTLFRSRS